MKKAIAITLFAIACKGGSDSAPASIQMKQQASGSASTPASQTEAQPAAPEPTPMRAAKTEAKPDVVTKAPVGGGGKDMDRRDGPASGENEKTGAKGGQRGGESAARAWFPETFLFAPLVVTDDAGHATVPVRVPDRLTSWRVLALAHSRTGAQGGATASFLGTLPTYVDPIVPKRLYLGDEVRIPVQLVNTTSAPVTTPLAIDAQGAKLSSPGGARTIPAQGSLVEYATLVANHPGAVRLTAELGGTDAVSRPIDVAPTGKLVQVPRSGTLAAPRTLALEGPAGSDPATDRVRLLVYPGALALLRSELTVSTTREGVADDAYALLLAGRATALLASLGDKANPEVLREITILAGQRAIRDARTLDVTSASLLAEAALAHPDSPVLSRLGERAAAYLAENQRADGTFAGGDGWTLQRVLVATADATRAAGTATATAQGRQRALGVAARAALPFERSLDQITDAYTAAAILASGAATGALRDKLRARVIGAIKPSDDGAKYLPVEEGVVRADGAIPTITEATALAVLGLAGDPKAPLADLGATLLGGYSPERGWGDGRANLACMAAVIQLFRDPLPASVKVTLTMDGKPITEGTLEREKLREVLTLEAPAPGLAGKHEWKVTAEPAVAGLGYALALRAWVPWDKAAAHGGLELQLPATISAQVGKPVELAIAAVAPSNLPLHVTYALPAGVQPDRPSLDALVVAGTLTRYTSADGVLDLYAPPLSPGQTFAAKLRAVPTLAGTLHSGPSRLEVGTSAIDLAPSVWTVR